MYLARTTPNIDVLIKPLEETLRKVFNDIKRDLLALPTRLSGLGIFDPCKKSVLLYSMFEIIWTPLVRLILEQSETFTLEVDKAQSRMRNNARKLHRQHEARIAENLKQNLPIKLQRSLSICSEKGASSWLSVLPISEHGIPLHKGAFRDALCLRYGW